MSTPARPDFDYSLLIQQLGPLRTRFDVDWLPSCDSTNTQLMLRAAQGAPSGTVLGTCHQSAGRGRRGRSWLSSPDASLSFSLLWRLPTGTSLDGLSLAVGLAVAQALEGLGANSIQLKWPNDIWYQYRKLGGILIEMVPSDAGTSLVIGIGLNLRQDPAWTPFIDQAYTALSEAGLNAARELVLGALLCELAQVLDAFAKTGFEPLCAHWCARNALYGQTVSIHTERTVQTGRCGHTDRLGALLIHQEDATTLRITHGDVSLRPSSTDKHHVSAD
jgi:BirA family biotin operon repressor/biotin-[acetyl-CoA-carboxylase] ligase